MNAVTVNDIRSRLYVPAPASHKGQNGKLLLIGGSKLFHAASLWALKVASRIVDMVYYSSIPENNEIILQAKKEFRDGIVIRRDQIDDYVKEADCILIGPGLPREEGLLHGDDDTYQLAKKLLTSYPTKKWVIDGGALQVMERGWIPKDSILTPHRREFFKLFRAQSSKLKTQNHSLKLETLKEITSKMAKRYNCIVLLKGRQDIVCSAKKCSLVKGGNAGMTKGGTGDVLAGLVAALYCKNDPFLSAIAASFINKRAGEKLFDKVGYYFNASDLVDEIPKIMKELFF